MADKAISELIAAERITATDMFVLEQNGTAKKLTGQVLLNWLTAAADGHGGIQSIVKKSTSGLVDTYRITLADTTYFDFLVTNGRAITSVKQTNVSGLTRTYQINFNDGGTQAFTVTDGRGITEIAKTSTRDLVDTYTISLNDGTSETFTVTNGEKGDKGDNQYVWIKYASQKPTEASHSFGDVADNWIGIYSGDSATAPTNWQQYTWFQIKGEKGNTGDPATVVSNVVEYQVSDSGTIIPSGAWGSSIPVVAQGKYMWTRTTTTFNSGSSAVAYSVSRMGMDGSGSVTSVANISPDENGNIPLTAEHIGALPNTGGDLTGELKMNGQPISGLNMPTADDQVANKLYVDQKVKKAAPRNLLDNSDFRNPVNQRGESSYAGKIIGIDRWQGGAGATLVTLADEGLKISFNTANGGTGTQPLMQYVNLSEDYAGKTVTFAARIKGGDVRIYFKGASLSYVNASDWTVIVYTDVIPANTEGFYVGLQGKNKSETLCEWMALYEGEYTVETLPEYQPKGYGVELAECQRYYQIVKYGYGSVKSDGTSVYTVLPLCVPMRKGSISVAQYSVASVRANGLRFDSNKITGATLFDYHKDTTSARIMVEGTFTGSENHIAYVDCTIHLSAEDL